MDTDFKNDSPFILNGEFYQMTSLDKSTGKVAALCKICEKLGKSKTINGFLKPTSNFTTHLKLCHDQAYQDYLKCMDCHSQKLRNNKQSKLPFTRIVVPSKVSKVEKLVMDYVINALVPLSTVEHPSFKSLIAGLNDGARCPARQRLNSLIKQEYMTKINKITTSLNASDYCCMTADIWSKCHRSFLGLTVHWLNKNLERESAVLTVQRISGIHDYAKITEVLLQIFTRFQIDQRKITCMVTDNGSNFVKAFQEYGVDRNDADEVSDQDEITSEDIHVVIDSPQLPHHQRCASHTLSLVATSDLHKANIVTPRGPENFKKVFGGAMAKCTALWNLSSRSNKTNEELVAICGKPLIRPVITRWNSLFDSITTLLEFKTKFSEIFKTANLEVLSSTEIDFLEEYIIAMKPVAYALDKLQGERSFYFGYLAPVILQTVKKLDGIVNRNHRFASHIATSLKLSIEKRFKSICELNIEECSAEICAAISHPYFKLRWIPIELQENLKLKFVAEVKRVSSAFEPRAQSSKAPRSLDDFFDFDDEEPQAALNNVELEVLKYLQDPSQDLQSLHSYPTICKVFRKYNTALTSSAPVERAFSYGSLVLSAKRSCLSDELLDMLIVLKVSF